MDTRTHLSDTDAQSKRNEMAREMSDAFALDDLCRFASQVAGLISGRLESFPDGQSAFPFKVAMYDRESAADVFEQAARYIRTGPHD